MESLINAFGIDIKLIIVQIINFLVLAGALTYLLYKPVLKLLDERAATIKQGIEDAKIAKESKEKTEEDKKVILTAANKEAEDNIKTAKIFANEKADEIIKGGEKRAGEIIRAAEIRAKSEENLAIKQAEEEIAKIAVLTAEKILRENK